MNAYSLIENRTIRVFISSTFQDMQDERSELIRKTFPRLRELAARRDVTLTEVDLRWGITKEESESGKVMEICLREVQNSIPFFIGIIGNRYGWIPGAKDISDIVKERFPDVPGYVKRQLSATEIEMQFGVLDSQENMNAYFFIKEEETADIDDPQKLAALKKAVRENKKYPVSTYQNPEDLADQVLVAFTKLLDDLFPVGELSALEKERLGQRAVLNNLTRVYIKNEANFAVIDEWMKDWEKHQLVITGESGMGKSALVANWVKEKLDLGDALPYRIIYHFVGRSDSVGNEEHIINTLCEEIRDRYGFDDDEGLAPYDNATGEEVPDYIANLPLCNLFDRVSSEGRPPLLIVLDGIDHLVDNYRSKLLGQLPAVLHWNVKMLFTTQEDDDIFFSVLEDEGVLFDEEQSTPVLALQPLTKEERIQLVEKYLNDTYSKHLQAPQIKKIVDDPQNENTLVLKILLDELANFGVFDKLDDKIEEYLRPDSFYDFYQVLLKNYETDFGESLVRRFLSLIAVSKDGLSEGEILKITGLEEKPLLWSQFYCSFRNHLIVKNGLISFSHEAIREAVVGRYLGGISHNWRDNPQYYWDRSCRKDIVAALDGEKTSEGKKTTRSMDEVPFQLSILNDLTKLHDYLMDMDVFSHLYKNEITSLDYYWWKLINKGKYSLEEYLADSKQYGERQWTILLNAVSEFADLDLGQQKALEFLMKASETRIKITGEVHPDIAIAYDNVGGIYKDLGDYKMALEYQEKALRIRLSVFGENHHDVAQSYRNVGYLYSLLGDHERTLEYYSKALEIARGIKFLYLKEELQDRLVRERVIMGIKENVKHSQ